MHFHHANNAKCAQNRWIFIFHLLPSYLFSVSCYTGIVTADKSAWILLPGTILSTGTISDIREAASERYSLQRDNSVAGEHLRKTNYTVAVWEKEERDQ